MPIDPKKFDKDFILNNERSKNLCRERLKMRNEIVVFGQLPQS